MNSTKKAIFDSAIKIFSAKGYNEAIMDEIAQNAGVAKGTLYYHFKSKEEIFSFIISEGLKTMKEDTIKQIEKEDNDVNRLRVFCLTQLNLANEHKDFIKVVISQLWGENARHLELRKEMWEYAKGIEIYVKMAIDKKLIKDDNTYLLSCSILGTVFSLAVHEIIKKDKHARYENGVVADGFRTEHTYDIEKVMENLLNGIGVQAS